MLKYLKKCLSKKYTLILVLIFILQNIKDEYFKRMEICVKDGKSFLLIQNYIK